MRYKVVKSYRCKIISTELPKNLEFDNSGQKKLEKPRTSNKNNYKPGIQTIFTCKIMKFRLDM